MNKSVEEQIAESMDDIFSWSLYAAIAVIIAAAYCVYDYNTTHTKLLAISDSELVVSMGKGSNSYYTNKSTIQFQATNNCVSFVDNRTNTLCTACGDYIIRELVKENK